MHRRSKSKLQKRKRTSYLEFKALAQKRIHRKWKPITIKIFDNGKLQCFKKKLDGNLEFTEEIDLFKMTKFGQSAKHHSCIEIFESNQFILRDTKHKFKIDKLNSYVTFIKYLEKFTEANRNRKKSGSKNKDNNIVKLSKLSFIFVINLPQYNIN